MLRKKRIKKNFKNTYPKKKSIWDIAIPIKFNYTPSENLFERLFEQSLIYGEVVFPVEYVDIDKLIELYGNQLTEEEINLIRNEQKSKNNNN